MGKIKIMKTLSIRGQKREHVVCVLKTSDLTRRFRFPQKEQPGYDRYHVVVLRFYYSLTDALLMCPSNLLMQYANEIFFIDSIDNGKRTAYEAYTANLCEIEKMYAS